MSYYIYIVNLMTATMKMGTVLDNGKTHMYPIISFACSFVLYPYVATIMSNQGFLIFCFESL